MVLPVAEHAGRASNRTTATKQAAEHVTDSRANGYGLRVFGRRQGRLRVMYGHVRVHGVRAVLQCTDVDMPVQTTSAPSARLRCMQPPHQLYV